jgi:hypothetical protein
MIFYYLLSLGLNIINIPYNRGENIKYKNDIDKIFSIGSNQRYNCVKNNKFS